MHASLRRNMIQGGTFSLVTVLLGLFLSAAAAAEI